MWGMGSRRAGSFAMIQPQRDYKVTSAALHTIGDQKAEGRRETPLRDQGWQAQAYDFLDQVGELGYLLNLKANIVAECTLEPQYLNDDGEWENTQDPRALRVMAAFIGPQGGQKELKRRGALHVSTAGESILVGLPGAVPTTGLLWEFLSTEEITIETTGAVTRRRDGGQNEPMPDDVYIARMWRSHPRFSDLADSEVRRVLRICDEILVLTQMVDAIAKSRLNAGILLVAEEFSFSTTEDEVEGEADESGDGIDPFTRDLIEHMSAPVLDRTSAASLVPLVLRGPAEQFDKAIKLVDLARQLDTWAQDLRQEALGRLSTGLDAPPEIVNGKSALNHWTAFNVDADFIVKHVAPTLSLLADFVTFAYFRPMLEAFEDVDPVECERFRVFGDTAPVTARQDEAASARALHDQLVLSDDTLLAANGFEDSDRPTDDELFQRRAWALVNAAPSVYAKALLPLIHGFEAIDPESLTVGAPGGSPAGGAPSKSDPNAAANPVDATSGQDQPTTPPALATVAMQLTVAADAALHRAMEKAGARLITKASRDQAIRDRLRAGGQDKAFTMVTDDEMKRIGANTQALMAGAWDRLAIQARGWLRAYMEALGMEGFAADDAAALAASNLCEAMGEYVERNRALGFRRQRNGTNVPDKLVIDCITPFVATPVG